MKCRTGPDLWSDPVQYTHIYSQDVGTTELDVLIEEPAALEVLLKVPALLEFEDGPPSGDVPTALVEGVVVNGGSGDWVTSQPGRGDVVVVVVVDVDVGGVVVVVEVVGVVDRHGGVVGVVVVDVGGCGPGLDVFGGFGVFVLGVGFGGWWPIDGGPDANASVSGSTGSDAIGTTPRA